MDSSHFFCPVQAISIGSINFLVSHNLIFPSWEVENKYKSLYKFRLVMASSCPLIESETISLEYILLIIVEGILFLKSNNLIVPSSNPTKEHGIEL